MSRTISGPVAGGAIQRDEAAYRRGLVLGLTMAEIMLLLVFCLLIAVSVVLKRDKDERIELATQLTRTEATLEDRTRQLDVAAGQARLQEQEAKRLTELVEAKPGASTDQKFDDDFRRLVRSDAVLQEIRNIGLVPEELVKKAEDIHALVPLIEAGRSGKEIADAAQQANALAESLGENPDLRDLQPDELARLAALGLEQERKASEGEHDWPPIINLSEAKGYSFAVGKAELTDAFEKQLRTTIAEQVLDNAQKVGATIVEVIGHTDEQPISPRPSNLDRNLIGVLNRGDAVQGLVPADNVGLGMARAASVASVLQSDPRFRSVTVLPLSAGQLILPGDWVTDGSFGGDAKERRRIEIRVRRPEEAQEAKSSRVGAGQ